MEALSLFDVVPDPPVGRGEAPDRTGSPAEAPAKSGRVREKASRGRASPTRLVAPTPLPRLSLLLAVDGNSVAHRAFHAYPRDEALRGFCALVAAVADRVGPDATVVGFDCVQRSSRRERWPAYKAQRPPKEAALRAFIADCTSLLQDLDVVVLSVEGWEADDVLASAAAAAEAARWRCVLATSDRDAYAQISPTTSVLRLRSGMDHAVEVTVEALAREVGVAPEQYVEFAAMRGDASDNLDGVPGVGAARGAALLEAFETVAAAVADEIGCRSVLGRPVGQALIDDLADPAGSVFLRNVALMTARRDLAVDLDACRRRVPPDRIEGLLFSRGLGRVAGRMAVAFGARPDWPPPMSA